MRKTLSVGVAAMTAAVGMLSAGGAEARDHGRYGYYDGRHGYYQSHRGRGHDGDALAAGIVGLALGAAIASSGNSRYDRSYSYGYGYDDGPRYYSSPRYGYYDRPYRRSCRNVAVWDPYYGRVYERRCW